MTTCDRCGFDGAEWDEQDATRTLVHADELLDDWSVDLPPALVRRIDARRADVRAAIDASPDLIDAVHHLWHGLVSIADQRHLADDAVPAAMGTITGLHRSDGGVPKRPVDAAAIGVRGVAGDRQATRLHHGRPWQALCLWSTEALEALVADGHPIAAGSVGENVTVSGLDWAGLRAGAVLDLGVGDESVRCQLWSPATPCSKNAQWFTDGDFGRLAVARDRASTRWYAAVVRPGQVRVGDPVTLTP